MGRASKDKRDIYYRKAKEEGFRARSAYKLLQINEAFNILNAAEITTGAVDLCAAPGSWSQVLSSHFKSLAAQTNGTQTGEAPRIVAVDLQEMAPIEGVTLLQGDITSAATAQKIVDLLSATGTEANVKPASPRKADIVVCDGAPDVTGMHELDEYLQHHLLLAALNITSFVLRDGGCFVTKMFRGPNTGFLVAKAELFFSQVRVVKPTSSRNASMESFLLCQGFRCPAGYVPRFTTPASAPQHDAVRDKARGDDSHLLTNAAGTRDLAGLRVSGYTPEAPRCVEDPAQAASLNAKLQPFLSCGDLSGFDADMCYDREDGAEVLAPVQPPLQAPYLNSDADTLKKPRIE